MPRTRSLAWSELKIGVLTIVAIAIAAITIFSLTGGKGFFWQRYSLKTRFTNVAGLKPGSPVRVAGVEVGSVKSVDLVGEEVDVLFDVNKDMRSRITDQSQARLGSVSLLGESAVDISPSTKGAPIPDYGYVPAGRAPAQISDITDQASAGIGELTNLIHGVREGKGTVGKLMTDDELYVQLRRFVAAAGELTDGLKQGRGTIGRLLKDPKAAQSLEASLSNIEAITKRIDSGEGSLGKLLKDDAFARSLSAATSNLESITGKLNRGEGTAGKLMTDSALYTQMSSAAEHLDLLVTRLNNGDGTAGQLLKDKQLYENINGAVGDLRRLIKEITANPKKYLNVKISIF